jgi:rhodanese-related sulfurtransferase
VLDVRNLNEFETLHLRGAMNIPLDDLRYRLDEVPSDRPLVVCCRSGYRSHLALRILAGAAHRKVRNLSGGYTALSAEGGFDLAPA